MRLLTCAVLLALTATAGASAAAQGPASTEVPRLPSVELPAALERVLRDYERSWRAADAEALSMLFAEDGFVMQGGRPPVRGRAAIRAAYGRGAGGPLKLRALAFDTSGSLGFILGAYGYDESGTDMGKYTLTLRREADGRWLIFSDMDNMSLAPRRTGDAPQQPPA